MFDLAEMTPGPIFARMFDDCAAGSLTRQDLLDYLMRGCWSRDPRGNDDRSIAILSKTTPEEDAKFCPPITDADTQDTAARFRVMMG